MGRPAPTEEDKIIETWESVIDGTTWVWMYDRREDRYKKARVGGREGSKRLHITRGDRQYNQEQIPEENRGLDPFTNGALKLISAEARDEHLDTRYHYTKQDLAEMFEVRDPELFHEAVSEISSELVIRRLVAIGENVGTGEQNRVLREICEQRYPIGGTQKTVREMIEAGERIGATRIY